MDDIYDLYENLKKVSKGEREAAEPIAIEFGTVKKLDPFTIDMGGYTIEEDFLVLTRTVKALIEGESCCKGHTCNYNGSKVCNGISADKCRFGKLKVGDCVVLLKDAGGEDYLVLDAAEVDDDE